MRKLSRFSILVGLLAIAVLLALGQAESYDILITGGRVLDGTGNPWFLGDVGIRAGKIVDVGTLGNRTARRVIDARGHYVVPGFIDIHSHSDEGLGEPATRTNPNVVTQGVTTVVVNQDGRSPWPIADQRARFERDGIGTNAILLIGHGRLRQLVMKQDYRRFATATEIEDMKKFAALGMQQGAFGLSAGLEYVPGRWSHTDELVELARAIAPYRGVYISHERAEGRDPMWKEGSDPQPVPDLFDAVAETITIGEKSGIVVVASHLKVKGARFWGAAPAAIRLIREARNRGVQVYADQYPYTTSGSDGSTVLIPDWARQDFRQRLEDPAQRQRVRVDIAHEIDRRGGAENIIIYDFPNRDYVEKSLAQIADSRKEDPIDTAIWIQLNGLSRAGGARMRGFSLSEVDIEEIMKQEFTATCSDGGNVAMGAGIPHARYYGTFPRKIRRYVFERQVLSLPFAIRSMTSLPAQILGLRDRGLVQTGYWADIAIFDPEKIADRSTFVAPHQYADGIPFVIVNGQFAVDGGRITGTLAGKVLTR